MNNLTDSSKTLYNNRSYSKYRLFRLVTLLLLGIISIAILQAQTVINHNIGTGDLIISGTSTANYHVTGTSTTINNRIIVGSGYNGTITLDNVTMRVAGVSGAGVVETFASVIGGDGNPVRTGSCIAIMGKNEQSNQFPVTKVNLVLIGDNDIQHLSNNGYCAIQVDQGAQIHIRAIDENDNNSGKLEAKSTSSIPGTATSGNGGAGIGAISRTNTVPYAHNYAQGTPSLSGSDCGATDRSSGGNIIISSGTITAWGGHAAGIGGGYRTYYDGYIIIYGGVVTASGGFDAAGIGSGCPTGTGVLQCNASNSTVFVLPPATITAHGAGANASGGVGGAQFAELGLTGTRNLTYLNDPDKHAMTIHTEDNEPNANIYLDLTETTGLVPIFNSLGISYDLTKVRVGRTNTSGTMELHGQLEQTTTFFTDASSSNAATLGRPYLAVQTTVLADQTIVLPLFAANISFTDIPSTPLEASYTTTQAQSNAHRIRVEYNDPSQMTGVTFQLQNGATSDFTFSFYGPDGVSSIAQPATLTNGMVFYIEFPIKPGRSIGVYSEVLLIGGSYGGTPLSNYIRRIVEQRIVYNDTNNNNNIKVTANPTNFSELLPTTRTVDLTLNINHIGQSVPYDGDDVTAKYIVTTEPNYNNALAATPLSGWSNLNVAATEGNNAVTTVSFSAQQPGTYYIHWHVTSGVIYAHSRDVINPPRQYGGFGPYELKYEELVLPICIGETASITASLETPGSINTPEYYWYDAATGGTLLHNGPTFNITTPIMADTTLYVSVEGSDYCESARRVVVIKVEDCASYVDKDATLLPLNFQHKGTHGNPVSVLHGEDIKYDITVTNASPAATGTVVIYDTIPAYLRYVPSSAVGTGGTVSVDVSKVDIDNSLMWTFTGIASMAPPVTATFKATPLSGAVASQPLFINKAWVKLDHLPNKFASNETYHQGAGISIVTFSANFGGNIFNATEQALDYRTEPRSGVLIVPEEGYAFAGWSHDDYTSLRGETIKAQDGIMYYDTLTIYGNVELRASFVPIEESLEDEPEEVTPKAAEIGDKVWAVKDELYVKTSKPGSIVRIYSPDGMLREHFVVLTADITKRKITRGIYIVTINNNVGTKVRID